MERRIVVRIFEALAVSQCWAMTQYWALAWGLAPEDLRAYIITVFLPALFFRTDTEGSGG